MGARYEYEPLPQPKVCNPDYPQTCHINSQATNLMPRIGLAYRLSNKTGPARRLRNVLRLRARSGAHESFPRKRRHATGHIAFRSTQPAQFAAGPVFPNNLSSVPAGYKLGAAALQFAAPNWKTPYSEQGTFAVEHQLTHDIALTATYIWSRGIQLYSERDLNLPPLSPLTYYVYD